MHFTIENDSTLNEYTHKVINTCEYIRQLIDEYEVPVIDYLPEEIEEPEEIYKAPKGTDYKTNKDIMGSYHLIKKGHKDILDYPTHYDEKTGELGICEGHGVYTWITKDDYTII